MRYLLKFFLGIFIAIYSLSSFSQIKGVGIPFIINHNRSTYNASTQNWAVVQSSSGLIYFGNNDGILEYDGTGWNLYHVPNYSIVRSLLSRGDTIYAGAFEQIGFLASDENGRMMWNSLNHLIPPEYKNFDEIWRIYEHRGRILFQSFRYIFIYENNQMQIIEPAGGFGFMHRSGDELFVVDREQGLLQLMQDTLRLVNEDPVFFRNDITGMLPSKYGTIIGTSGEGLYLWDRTRNDITAWNNEVNPLLRGNNLFTAIALNGGYYAFGSVSNGLFITDGDGNVLQHINRIKGLQNNTILALFQDRRNNLWLGLDNGIDFLEVSSPLTLLNHNYNIETAYATVIHKDMMYVGTNQGLFAAPLTQKENMFNKLDFRLVQGTEGQVWSLQVIDDILYCGHNFGSFQVNGFQARQISDIRGFWLFFKPHNVDKIIAGTYSGLVQMERNSDGRFKVVEIPGFNESSRQMILDENNYIWVSHGYKGLFRLKLNDDFSRVDDVLLLFNEAGLPPSLPYSIHKVFNKMVVATSEGILKYNYEDEKFETDDEISSLFAGKGYLDKIFQDKKGNIWYYTQDQMGVMRRLEDGTYRDITAPFTRINSFLLPAFQNIFIADPANIFIGSQNGLVHYNPGIINDYNVAEDVYIKDIMFYGRNNDKTLLFRHPERGNRAPGTKNIPYTLNSVGFHFTSTAYENPQAIRFSYRLEGFDNNWSEWDGINFKEYTNLREGNYTFQVKALNSFGVESPITSYYFEVNPPFYRSATAWFIYFILLLILIASNFFYVRKRMLKIKANEKIRHEINLARREQLYKEQSEMSEKEIMQLRNERLITEMNHKNKELANATLHLIQKNKTLTLLKNDLGKLLKSIPSENPEKHSVNNLLKKVNKDLRNEKNWELFNDYFDEVHQDFITRLKEKHNDLSPKELRLSAYLRMNLSTKEIAPLMNISIRGVEISRYRLRKKLQLEHDVNLTDYLISY
jgi:ligand-binding sensor domain-containing protein/DNA-binding CsgD family transcriptional regulator